MGSCERRGGLMVSALDSGASGPGSSPGRGHCVMVLSSSLMGHLTRMQTLPYLGSKSNRDTFRKLRFSIFHLSFYIICPALNLLIPLLQS